MLLFFVRWSLPISRFFNHRIIEMRLCADLFKAVQLNFPLFGFVDLVCFFYLAVLDSLCFFLVTCSFFWFHQQTVVRWIFTQKLCVDFTIVFENQYNLCRKKRFDSSQNIIATTNTNDSNKTFVKWKMPDNGALNCFHFPSQRKKKSG